VLAALLAGLAVLAVLAVAGLWLWLADGIALFGAFALPDAALVPLVVGELREIDDFDGNLHLVAPGLTQVAVLDELRQVLPALFAHFAVPFEVVFQSHL